MYGGLRSLISDLGPPLVLAPSARSWELKITKFVLFRATPRDCGNVCNQVEKSVELKNYIVKKQREE